MVGEVTSRVVRVWELGLRLRERREQLGLTAVLVGKTTGIGGMNLSAIEGGKRRLTATKLIDLAGVYDLIPGLLQTVDYARATIKEGLPYIRPVEVGPRLAFQLARQAQLSGPSPLRLSAVIHQAALLQQVGGPTVLAHQLEHLTTIIDDMHDHVEVRVLPFSAGAHALTGYPITILSFDSPRLPEARRSA